MHGRTMKTSIAILIAVLMVSSGAYRATAEADAEKEVMTAMEAWRHAMMKKDGAALGRVYHSDLSYGHSSGQIETRPEAVKHMVDTKTDYTEVDLTDTKVKINGNMALVHGKVHFKQVNAGQPTDVNLVVLHVWLKGPQGWQMIGRQSTRPPQ
jgi:ketosteroid isomerase-like protein